MLQSDWNDLANAKSQLGNLKIAAGISVSFRTKWARSEVGRNVIGSAEVEQSVVTVSNAR